MGNAEKVLTFGMATYDDFAGVAFTLQAIRLYHTKLMDRIALLVVDNYPSGNSELARFCGSVGAKYVHVKDVIGTSRPRDAVFRNAETPWVMCVDSHVMLLPGGLEKFLDEVCTTNSQDFYQGPIFWDGGGFATHFDTILRDEMYGTWSLAWTWPGGDYYFCVRDNEGKAEYRVVQPGDPPPQDANLPYPLPEVGYAGHEQHLLKAGYVPAVGPDFKPFKIPGQGLGLFACRKDAWLGFHPNHMGFGGEELYIHEKFRRAGRNCWCLPYLGWWHFFGQPRSRSPVRQWDKARNYVLEFNELGLDLGILREHFVEGKNNRVRPLMPAKEWDYLVEDPVNHVWDTAAMIAAANEKPGGCSGCGKPIESISAWYESQCKSHQDIGEHLPYIKELADRCTVVAELGCGNGGVTSALLSSSAKEVWTLDIRRPSFESKIAKLTKDRWFVVVGDSRTTPLPTEVDLLVIDTMHRADWLEAELNLHAPRVRHYIVLHDTETFGVFGQLLPGEQGSVPGLRAGLINFLRNNKQWSVISHRRNQHGLTILSCDPADKPKLPSTARQIFNFSKSFATHVASGARQVTEDQLAERLDLCALCEHRNENRCSICGCFIAEGPVGGKAQWADQSCPIGKWLPIEREG